MFRSGLWAGHGKVGILFSAFQALAAWDTWHGALSSWNIQSWLGKCWATTGHKFWSSTSIYLSMFMFLSTVVKVPTPSYIAHTAPKHNTGHRFSLRNRVLVLPNTVGFVLFLILPPNINPFIFTTKDLCYITEDLQLLSTHFSPLQNPSLFSLLIFEMVIIFVGHLHLNPSSNNLRWQF